MTQLLSSFLIVMVRYLTTSTLGKRLYLASVEEMVHAGEEGGAVGRAPLAGWRERDTQFPPTRRQRKNHSTQLSPFPVLIPPRAPPMGEACSHSEGVLGLQVILSGKAFAGFHGHATRLLC